MRNAFSLLLPLALVLGLSACSSNGSSDADPSSKEQKDNPVIEAKAKPARKAYTEEELNAPYSTVSPWRYIVTGPETQYFERLVKTSSLARTVHSSGHAVLVPRDLTFQDNKDWKALMEEDNIEALDRFVGAHILKGVKSIKELDGAYENFNGDMVAIETNATGERVCGGARLLNQEIETDYGLVIPVVGMVEDIRWN